MAGDSGRTLGQLALEFGRRTTSKDWNSAPDTAEAEKIGLRMLHEIFSGQLRTAESQVRQTATASILEMRSARNEMITIANSRTSWLKWVAAFTLGVLTQMGIVVVHLGKWRAAALALTLFSIGMAFMLWVTLMRINPFVGKNAVALTPISAVYAPSG